MPPKNKKNKQKNSFYFFMKDMQEKEAAKGRSITMVNMPNYAHPIWQKMSIPEREPFELMARQYKNDPNLRGGRLASDGSRLEDNLRELEEKEMQENAVKQAIRNYVNGNCNLSLKDFKDFQSRRMFYFISFNILCQTETAHFPNEVGLVEYSIQHGIHRVYHTLIYPGSIPTGYTGEAKRHNENHQIDIFGEKESERNIRGIYEAIKSFVTDPESPGEFPPLFTPENEIEKTRGCLDWLSRKIGDRTYLEVWNATHLLMELRDGVNETFPSPVLASDLLNKTCFNYIGGSRCNFHEEKDVDYCALSYSKRLCFLLSDAVCSLFDVDLTESHIPTRSNEEKSYVVIGGDDFHQNGESNLYSQRRLEKSSDYPQNNYVRQEAANGTAPQQSSQPQKPRQPASMCIAAQMTKLRLNMNAAAPPLPGHGIGRGQRRNLE